MSDGLNDAKRETTLTELGKERSTRLLSHFNRLSPPEAERLALLAEECGEVIQVIGKILRHGYESRHPNGGPTNRELLEKELGDVDAAIRMMFDADDIIPDHVDFWNHKKQAKVKQYLHHQG